MQRYTTKAINVYCRGTTELNEKENIVLEESLTGYNNLFPAFRTGKQDVISFALAGSQIFLWLTDRKTLQSNLN